MALNLIIEPNRYTSFVDEDWKLEQLFNHFKGQITMGNMLLWSTGECNTWNVEINNFFTSTTGYRESVRSIRVYTGKLYLINYESLTMGAQFSNICLPEGNMMDLGIELENGNYNVRIVQFYNPNTFSYIGRNDIDFLIEFERSVKFENISNQIIWSNT